jgi:hypothetical protein
MSTVAIYKASRAAVLIREDLVWAVHIHGRIELQSARLIIYTGSNTERCKYYREYIHNKRLTGKWTDVIRTRIPRTKPDVTWHRYVLDTTSLDVAHPIGPESLLCLDVARSKGSRARSCKYYGECLNVKV